MAVDRSAFDLAGYTSASTGILGKAVPPGIIVNVGSTVRIEEGYLCWSIEPYQRVRYVSPNPEMFDSFLGLWDLPDSAIVRFAKKWGASSSERGSFAESYKRQRTSSTVAISLQESVFRSPYFSEAGQRRNAFACGLGLPFIGRNEANGF